MSSKTKNITVTVLFACFLAALSLFCWFKPADAESLSERRPLDQFPELSFDTIVNATFMNSFESYALDQFPLRDTFRAVKAFTALNIMGQKDVNDLYIKDGIVSKVEYPTNFESISNATDIFNSIYDKYIKDKANKVYTTLVPDKNYYMADKYGYLSIDYAQMAEIYKSDMAFAEYIDIFPLLSMYDYYKTDTHWKQENIYDVAKAIAEKMGVSLSEEYTEQSLGEIFKGVYGYQFALSFEKDELKYMVSDYQKDLIIKNYNTGVGVEIPMYTLEKAEGKDPYDIFLSGAKVSVVTIENPNVTNGKELVIFRDSFGSSISPYFAEGYSKITLIDPRTFDGNTLNYLISQGIVSFDGADVLYMFSTTLLNNSVELKIF